MQQISLTFTNLDAATAARILAAAGGNAPAASAPAAPPAAAPAAPPRAAAPPAAPPAAAPVPTPAPAPAAAAIDDAALLAAMQGYGRVHKAAGVKAVFDRLGLAPSVPACPPEKRAELLAAFQAV